MWSQRGQPLLVLVRLGGSPWTPREPDEESVAQPVQRVVGAGRRNLLDIEVGPLRELGAQQPANQIDVSVDFVGVHRAASSAQAWVMRFELMTTGAPLRRIQDLARDAASAGFSGLVVTEGARTAYLACAAAALAADIDISTGIAVAFPRSPMLTAQSAWELAELSGGRFRLGLGTQVRAHIERRYATEFDPPGPRLREYVDAVRAIFRAFRGDAP